MMDKYYFIAILCVCITVVNGTFCTKYKYGLLFDTVDDTMYCTTSCCGNKYNTYCCPHSNVGLIAGIVVGVLGLVAIVVGVLVTVLCCCRKSRGQAGQVAQPAVVATTVPVYGMQTAIVAGPGHVGYTNAAFPQHLQTSNMPGPVENAPQEPPPSYNTK